MIDIRKTRKQRMQQLLNEKPSFDRDKEITDMQKRFILKTGISRRLFDGIPTRSKKLPHVDRRSEQ